MTGIPDFEGKGVSITQSKMTHKERLLELAERFPMLRQECQMRSEFHTCYQQDDKGEFTDKQGGRWTRKGCPNCQGRGWLPVDNLEATLEATSGSIAFDRSGQGWACRTDDSSRLLSDTWTNWCKTPNEAAVLALYQTVKAEEEKL